MTETSKLTNAALISSTEKNALIAPRSYRRRGEKPPASGSSRPLGRADAARTIKPEPHVTKTSLVIALLCREHGASIDELVTAAGWLPHTTRAALTGLRKKGHVVTSERIAGLTHYRITAVA